MTEIFVIFKFKYHTYILLSSKEFTTLGILTKFGREKKGLRNIDHLGNRRLNTHTRSHLKPKSLYLSHIIELSPLEHPTMQ